MTPGVRKGVIVAAIHLALVASLGAKLLVDRATRPRVWARVAPIDPNLPIRGRYVRLAVEGIAENLDSANGSDVTLTARGGTLVFQPSPTDSGLTARVVDRDGRRVAVLNQPLAFFIPEHVPDPSIRAPGEELWVEVTLPRRGAPRPIRLGVMKDLTLTPLDY